MNRINDAPMAVPSTDTNSNDNGAQALKLDLERAAELAVVNGVTPEVFSQMAIGAYASKNPAFREQLETMQLAAQLEFLRAQGRMGIA